MADVIELAERRATRRADEAVIQLAEIVGHLLHREAVINPHTFVLLLHEAGGVKEHEVLWSGLTTANVQELRDQLDVTLAAAASRAAGVMGAASGERAAKCTP